MVAVDLVTEHIRVKLQQPDLKRIYPNLEVRGRIEYNIIKYTVKEVCLDGCPSTIIF
jgi:hypothetical protein